MNFITSLDRYSSGIAHDLVVIRKGFPSRKTAFDRSLAQTFPHSVSVSDDGSDITAYANAAAQLPHRRVVFLNTFSEIAADGWLRKLDSAFDDTEVGIAGATASYESPLSSMKRVQKGWWLIQNKGIPNPAGTLRLLQAIRRRLPKWLATKLMSIAISYFAAQSSRAKCDQTLDAQFETYWANQIGPSGALARLKDMKVFPNPHIRTNAFMIKRELFLDVLPDLIETKNDSYLFESGPNGLTQQILRRGMKAVVVGANGRVYAMEEWGDSGTFRLGDQHNLLVKDNQTRAFQNMTAAEKAAFTTMTWGDGPPLTGKSPSGTGRVTG